MGFRVRGGLILVVLVTLLACGGEAATSGTVDSTAEALDFLALPALPEMTVHSIRSAPEGTQWLVVLKETNSDRYLPIVVAPVDGAAIALKLDEVLVPRPLAHDLLRSVIDGLGAVVHHVVISDFLDDIFYAKVFLVEDGVTTALDARPSDAIALALRVRAPIFCEEKLLEQLGVIIEGGLDNDASQE